MSHDEGDTIQDARRRAVEAWWFGDRGSPFNHLLDSRLVDLADGVAVFEANPARKFYHPQGRCHGGFAAAVIDSAMGCAEARLTDAAGKLYAHGSGTFMLYVA